MSNLEHQVKLLLSEKLGLDISDISLNSSLTEDLGLDSLDAVELIMNLEKGSGFVIPDDQAEKMKTVEDIVLYLEANGCTNLTIVGCSDNSEPQEESTLEKIIEHGARHLLYHFLGH